MFIEHKLHEHRACVGTAVSQCPSRVRHMAGMRMCLLKKGMCVKDDIIEFTPCLLAGEVVPDGKMVGLSAGGF